MENKEIVDKYLLDNFIAIEEARNKPGFKWSVLANQIIPNLNGEYVRGRFRKIRETTVVLKSDYPDRDRTNNYDATGIVKPFCYEYKENKEKGTSEIKTETLIEIKTAEELIKHLSIDITKWKITNWWCKRSFSGKYAVSAFLKNIENTTESITLSQDFISKLSDITPIPKFEPHKTNVTSKPKASLLIPKQDVHWNKRDIDGKNSIEDRFSGFIKLLLEQLEKVIKTNELEKITYIIGSDEFNSEWTETTTKGTPQSNILTYQQSFEKISEFNIETIKLLRVYAPKIEVVLLNGNHDHNAGWHLATLLKQVFKKNQGIEVNDSIDNTKVIPFHSTLVLLNHGDAIKPKDLAAKFPIIAKDVWSNYSNYIVVCGDKHHEMSHDFHGTIFYQVPQLSTAKSDWDDKKGYITSKAELLLFLFEEEGLSNILRKQIK